MKPFSFLLENFFTHKDFLPPADQLPGTLFTPLHFVFATILLLLVIGSAVYVAKHRRIIRPVFITLWITLVVLEVVIVTWESVCARNPGFDLRTNLSLYPCSIFMYVMPFAIWGDGFWKKMACGYVFTLGLLGSAINFFYPAIRLSEYSCISFAGFHTYFYHGAMLFTFLVMLLSHYHSYHAEHWWDLFIPCTASLLVSIPANIINYSPIHADYMFFRGHFPLLMAWFPNAPDWVVTVVLYGLYIFIPALFYLPSYLSHLRHKKLAATSGCTAN